MEKIRLIIKQTMLVEVDVDGFEDCDNFIMAMNDGHLEIIEIIEQSMTTEDGTEVIDDVSLEDVKQLVLSNVREVVGG